MKILANPLELKLHVSLVICCVFLLFVIISFAISKSRDRFYKSNILTESNSARVFIIDLNKEKVTYFNVSSLRNIREMDLETFFLQYATGEKEKVEEWVRSLVSENNDVDNYLETSIHIEKDKTISSCLLRVQKCEKETKRIHIISYLLKSSSIEPTKDKRRIISSKNYVQNEINKNKRKNGFCLAFEFFYSDKSKENQGIDPLFFGNIKNYFFKYLSNSRFLIEHSENCLIVVETKCKQAINHAEIITKEIIKNVDRYLDINGMSGSIDIYIGAVEFFVVKRDLNRVITDSIRLAETSRADNNTETINWFSYGKRMVLTGFENSYRTEVDRIIASKKIINKFRLIYDVNKMIPYGYFCNGFLKDNFFQDMSELADYATRTGDLRDLMSNIVKDIVPKFQNQKPNNFVAMYFPARIEEQLFLVSCLTQIPNSKDVRINLVYKETDLLNQLQTTSEEEVFNTFKIFKSKGLNISLFANEDGLKLSNAMYGLFDSFIVSFSNVLDGISAERNITTTLHSIVEKLIKYQKPIICNDLEGWDAIELLVRSGLTYICSESFSPFNEMLLRPDPKSVKKIENMKG